MFEFGKHEFSVARDDRTRCVAVRVFRQRLPIPGRKQILHEHRRLLANRGAGLRGGQSTAIADRKDIWKARMLQRKPINVDPASGIGERTALDHVGRAHRAFMICSRR